MARREQELLERQLAAKDNRYYRTLFGWAHGPSPMDPGETALAVLLAVAGPSLLKRYRRVGMQHRGLDAFLRAMRRRPHGAEARLVHVRLGGWGYWDSRSAQRRSFEPHEFVLRFFKGGEVGLYQSYRELMTLRGWLKSQRQRIESWPRWLADFEQLLSAQEFNAEQFGQLFGVVHCSLFAAPLWTYEPARDASVHLMADRLEFSILEA